MYTGAAARLYPTNTRQAPAASGSMRRTKLGQHDLCGKGEQSESGQGEDGRWTGQSMSHFPTNQDTTACSCSVAAITHPLDQRQESERAPLAPWSYCSPCLASRRLPVVAGQTGLRRPSSWACRCCRQSPWLSPQTKTSQGLRVRRHLLAGRHQDRCHGVSRAPVNGSLAPFSPWRLTGPRAPREASRAYCAVLCAVLYIHTLSLIKSRGITHTQ